MIGLALLVALTSTARETRAARLVVNASGGADFTTITAAVAAAATGDTIEVVSGEYPEHVSVNKRLLIRSQAGSAATTISYPTTSYDVVDILVNNVILEGFTLVGGRYGLEVASNLSAFEVGDCRISEPLRFHASVPAQIVDAIATNVEFEPHGSGQYDALLVVDGTIANSVTWPVLPAGFVYYLPNGSYVNVTGTEDPVLTLLPNTTVKVQGGAGILVGSGGALSAEGVVFTSYRDDAYEGDSNGDGASAGAPGDWHQVSFNTGFQAAACRLVDCDFLYGGISDNHMVYVNGGSFPLEDCRFLSSSYTGLGIHNASVPVTGCRFQNNRWGLYMSGTATAEQITGNVIGPQNSHSVSFVLYAVPDCIGDLVAQNTLRPRTDGRYGRIAIENGTLTRSATWPVPPDSLVYYFHDDNYARIEGAGSPVLTLLPGTTVKSNIAAGILVGSGGALSAEGVVFTSYRDDAYEGDSNGDGASAGAPGDWNQVSFNTGFQAAACRLVDCDFLYGGISDNHMVYVNGGSFPLEDCRFLSSSYTGLGIHNASVPVTGCRFQNNRWGLYMSGTATAEQITGNVIGPQNSHSVSFVLYAVPDCIGDLVAQNTLRPRTDGRYGRIAIENGTLTRSATWPVPPDSLVYYFHDDNYARIEGAGSPVLTLLPGTTVKSNIAAGILVGSGGALSAEGVVFTSYRDDGYEGDSNGDGASVGAPGDWNCVDIMGGGNATFTDCSLIYGGVGGVGVTRWRTGSSGRLAFSVLHGNRIGIYANADARPQIVACCIVGNTNYGVYSQAPTDGLGSLPARDCWWGHPSGPSGEGPGTGDPVSDHVLFDRWTTYPRCEDFPIAVPPELSEPLPERFAVYAAYPNPFNPRTTIRFDLAEAGPVRVAIFDLAGRLVRTLVDENLSAGSRETVWDGRDSWGRNVGSGSYVARVESGDTIGMVRLGLIR